MKHKYKNEIVETTEQILKLIETTVMFNGREFLCETLIDQQNNTERSFRIYNEVGFEVDFENDVDDYCGVSTILGRMEECE